VQAEVAGFLNRGIRTIPDLGDLGFFRGERAFKLKIIESLLGPQTGFRRSLRAVSEHWEALSQVQLAEKRIPR
jgi:hypothetical protein